MAVVAQKPMLESSCKLTVLSHLRLYLLQAGELDLAQRQALNFTKNALLDHVMRLEEARKLPAHCRNTSEGRRARATRVRSCSRPEAAAGPTTPAAGGCRHSLHFGRRVRQAGHLRGCTLPGCNISGRRLGRQVQRTNESLRSPQLPGTYRVPISLSRLLIRHAPIDWWWCGYR